MSGAEKVCPKCGFVGGLEEFYRDKYAPDGRKKNCKKCEAAIATRSRQFNILNEAQYAAAHPLKECGRCGLIKNLQDFARHRGHRDGRGSLCLACNKEKYEKYKQENPDKVLQSIRFRMYGLTHEAYVKLQEKQKDSCAICARSFFLVRTCVDHSHQTKKVRGLLCDRCNFGLGKFLDDPALLLRAAQYLKEAL